MGAGSALDRILEKDMGSAERLGVCGSGVSTGQDTRLETAFTLTLVDAGAGFDGDEAPTSDLAMLEWADAPLVFEFMVDACRRLGDVMCAWRLGGL